MSSCAEDNAKIHHIWPNPVTWLKNFATAGYIWPHLPEMIKSQWQSFQSKAEI